MLPRDWSDKIGGPEGLYDLAQEDTDFFLTNESAKRYRVYGCQCFATEIVSFFDLGTKFIEFDGWACGGHPIKEAEKEM